MEKKKHSYMLIKTFKNVNSSYMLIKTFIYVNSSLKYPENPWINKLASLEASLVQNYDPVTDPAM